MLVVTAWCTFMSAKSLGIFIYTKYRTMETVNSNYVTYIRGNCNVVLASPHGGFDILENAPIRGQDSKSDKNGRGQKSSKFVLFQDVYTRAITEKTAEKIQDLSNKTPHIVHMNVHRRYVDVNRPKTDGTSSHPSSEAAWDEYHKTLQDVKNTIPQGIFFDIHGQKHPHGLLELGYCVKPQDLNDHSFSASETSIRNLASRVKVDTSLADLIWGNASFGAMLQSKGINCIPSPQHPVPGTMKYYSGGYSTETYGSLHAGGLDAIQVEIPKWLRNSENAERVAEALAQTILEYTDLYYE